jgi:hypothetical protein
MRKRQTGKNQLVKNLGKWRRNKKALARGVEPPTFSSAGRRSIH